MIARAFTYIQSLHRFGCPDIQTYGDSRTRSKHDVRKPVGFRRQVAAGWLTDDNAQGALNGIRLRWRVIKCPCEDDKARVLAWPVLGFVAAPWRRHPVLVALSHDDS